MTILQWSAWQLRSWWQALLRCCLFGLVLACLMGWAAPAMAGLNDDHFDGNIFPLYAGSGSLVPPKVTLAEALQRHRPALLVFYIDDSKDCKQYSSVVSRLDGPYGWAADFIPINIDALPVKSNFEPTEPGYYYKGFVPQTVLINQSGKVVLDEKGILTYEQVDDVFREVFDLLPRSESVELRRRQLNEITTELSPS
ncbi:MAG: thylakoid membrane photosystem I accumulation factor [Synechococcales cyanobacterium C42_A2020_086]|nr:thylakoid membrane photosystem I accumulation factor [Synechococcales cyanobacterium C42_A2020_086]